MQAAELAWKVSRLLVPQTGQSKCVRLYFHRPSNVKRFWKILKRSLYKPGSSLISCCLSICLKYQQLIITVFCKSRWRRADAGPNSTTYYFSSSVSLSRERMIPFGLRARCISCVTFVTEPGWNRPRPVNQVSEYWRPGPISLQEHIQIVILHFCH